MQKFYLLALCLFLSIAQLAAQRPSRVYRLPAGPDMPEWAKQIYIDDSKVNVFALDEAYKPWKQAYETLKREINRAGPAATEAQKAELLSLKKYYKYYKNWRHQVHPYVQPDGSLDFTIKANKGYQSKPKQGADLAPPPSNTWTHLGPTRTRRAVNEEPLQPLRPYQDNVFTIAIAPSDPNTLYCGTQPGTVNKTTDKGLHWSPVGLDYFTAGGMRASAIHLTDPDIVYIGNGDGVHTSTDGGVSWAPALVAPGVNPQSIVIKPDDPEVVLAAGDNGVYRRTAGNVWTQVISGVAWDLAIKPGDPSIVYALRHGPVEDLTEFWKSTDGGLTFSVRSTGWITGDPDGGGRIAVTPADNDRIYVVLTTYNGPRILRSDDAGETWAIVASTSNGGFGDDITGPLGMGVGQGFYDLAIMASPTDADDFIVGTTSTYKSTDGGTTYAPLGGYAGPFQIHPDVQRMVAQGGDAWIATDGGTTYSTDFFTSLDNYETRIAGLVGSEFWGFDQGWNEDMQVGGRYHNGNTARREAYPEGEFLYVGGAENATGYLNPGITGMAYFSDIGGQLLPETINAPSSYFPVGLVANESFYSMEFTELRWDPRYAYTFYYGLNNTVVKTTDNGLTNTPVFTHADPGALCTQIEVSRSDPNVIYFMARTSAYEGELWKTTNGGASWALCANPVGPTAGERSTAAISLSGTDANVIWWAFQNAPNGNKIFMSTNGGASWTNRTTSTLDDVTLRDMVHQLGTDGGVYLSSSNGLYYYRNNSMPDWVLYNDGLPIGDPGRVRTKIYYKGKKLRMATAMGIWGAALYENSSTTLVQPMTDHATNDCTRDTIQLESYSVVNGAATYQWSLLPAPQWISDANIRNPRVVLSSTPGAHSATLTVTDDNGVTIRTVNNFINNLPSGNLCAAEVVPGKSLSLNGSASALANGNLNLNSNTVTITAWVKRNGPSYFPGLVLCQGGTTDAGIMMDAGDNTLKYKWTGSNDGFGFGTSLALPDNAWAHVALVITPTDATLYLNGVGETNALANAPTAFDAPIKMGNSEYGNFAGQIDEVTVWNTALTQDQIRELMHLTLSPSAQPNLVAYYQFNEASGFAHDKVSTRHASLINATRVVSTGPFGGGTSNRQTVTTGGLKTFTGTDVLLGFPAAGTYPDGEIVVSRINLAPDSLPTCTAYTSDNHYWIIDNYGTNQTFTALDSMRIGNIAVPATNVVSPTSYKLNRRTANAHLLPWALQPGSSIGATGGATGRITFGIASGITQFGQFIATACGNTISGTVLWEHDGTSGVNLTTVKLTGDQTATTTTNTSGAYSLAATSGSNFTVTPTKNINKLNGVTAADAARIQQHVANSNPITDAYKQVAADVNKSNSITTADVSVINQSLLGNPAALVQFKTSWRFVPTTHTMIIPPWGFPEIITLTGVGGNVPDQNFFGIKTGDVVATFANPANFGAGNPMVLNVQDQWLQTDTEMSITFKVNQLEDLAAFQFALKFDVEKLELMDIQPLADFPLSVDHFGTYNISEGEIRVVWSQAEGVFLEEAAPVFSLKFKALQNGNKLSEVLQISPDESGLPALAYNSTLAESGVELNFWTSTGTGGPVGANGLQLFQNRPNPFSGTTAIGFVLPESCEAQLRVFDVSGRVLAERKAQYPAGRHEEVFDLKGATGVLYYELTTPFGVVARKMVAVKN